VTSNEPFNVINASNTRNPTPFVFNITVDGDRSDGKLVDDGKTDREEDMNLCCTFGTAASQKIETVKRKIPVRLVSGVSFSEEDEL
jgi:hypothetical protein